MVGNPILDGPLDTASFAQPSGLVVHEDYLYVVDSETSALREIHLKQNVVNTLVGKGLFDFGDRSGVGSDQWQRNRTPESRT